MGEAEEDSGEAEDDAEEDIEETGEDPSIYSAELVPQSYRR